MQLGGAIQSLDQVSSNASEAGSLARVNSVVASNLSRYETSVNRAAESGGFSNWMSRTGTQVSDILGFGTTASQNEGRETDQRVNS